MESIEKIARMQWPEAVNASVPIEEMLRTAIECAPKGSLVIVGERLKTKPLRIRTAFAFLAWHGDLNEIIEYINIATGDLVALSTRHELSAGELWARYRLLIRTIFNESYRAKEVCGRFFKDLKRLDLIDESERQMLSQTIRDLLQPLVDIRNRITHKDMPVIEEERGALACFFAEAARCVVIDTDTGQRLRPASEVGEIAYKIALELNAGSKELFTFLRRLSDILADNLVGGLVAD